MRRFLTTSRLRGARVGPGLVGRATHRGSAQVRHACNTICGTDPSDNPRKAKLTLADGTVFEGISFGSETPVNGEVVFSTGMTGYTEALTDPSFRGQVRSGVRRQKCSPFRALLMHNLSYSLPPCPLPTPTNRF